MSKNLTIDGVQYTDVQKIEAIDTDTDQYVDFVDTSDANASSADILSGKTAYVNGQKITGSLAYVSSEDSGCLFIDYEGTELYQYTTAQALALTELPANPSHTGLTALGWNWTLQEIKDYLTDCPDAMVVVGQLYTTDDGASRFYISLTESQALTPTIYLNVYPNTQGYLDWGDGSQQVVIENSTGSSITFSNTHEYSSTGDYIISVKILNGAVSLSSSGHRCGLFTRYSGDTDANSVYLSSLKKVYFGQYIYYSDYGLANAVSVSEVICPQYDSTATPKNTFYNCYALKAFVCKRQTGRIAEYCFYNSGVKYVSIGTDNWVDMYSSYCFSRCINLKYITFSSRVSAQGLATGIASGCRSLRSSCLFYVSTYQSTTYGSNAFSSCTSLIYAVLKPLTSVLPTGMFSGCTQLSNIVGLNNITNFGTSCLQGCPLDGVDNFSINSGCTNIESSSFNGTNISADIQVPSGVTSLPAAFTNSRKIRSVSITNNTTSILPSTFYGNTSLEEVTLGTGIDFIQQNTFYDCLKLHSIHLPQSLRIIGQGAFTNCISLTNIELPDGLTSIGTQAFSNCTNLYSINIPSSVTSMGTVTGNRQFEYCYGLQIVRFNWANPIVVFPDTFSGVDSGCAYLLPFQSFANYTGSPFSSMAYKIGFATYPVGDALPTTDTSGTYNAVWYATIADAKTQTNPITVGNGNEIYCRCTATS
jgi:hypothetical protein